MRTSERSASTMKRGASACRFGWAATGSASTAVVLPGGETVWHPAASTTRNMQVSAGVGRMVQYRNTAGSYGMVAQAFHWIVAILVILQFPLGMYAADLPVSLARLQ